MKIRLWKWWLYVTDVLLYRDCWRVVVPARSPDWRGNEDYRTVWTARDVARGLVVRWHHSACQIEYQHMPYTPDRVVPEIRL